MKKNYFFAVCLVILAAAFASCGKKNESKNNDKNLVASVPNQRDIEKDSLMLVSEIWGRIAEDKNIDFSQDTAHILIEKAAYHIDAYYPEPTPISAFFENNKGIEAIDFVHGAQRYASPLPGCSLIYQGVHKSHSDQFSHYILVIDRKVYAEAQAKAKAERKIVEVRYSDGTVETF